MSLDKRVREFQYDLSPTEFLALLLVVFLAGYVVGFGSGWLSAASSIAGLSPM